MNSPPTIVLVEPLLLAVAEAELDRREIASHIRGLFGCAYAWLKTATVRQVGHNYAIYDKGSERELRVRAGFPVSGPFAETAAMKNFQLGAGRAAFALHVGPYSELHRTYAHLHEWCKREGVRPGRLSWEAYGDWHPDPSKLETGLFLQFHD